MISIIKKISKFITTSTIVGLVLLTPIQSNAMITSTVDITTNESTYNNISPFATNTGWRYKFENGNTYKRLYNYDTGKWIGNWILVN